MRASSSSQPHRPTLPQQQNRPSTTGVGDYNHTSVSNARQNRDSQHQHQNHYSSASSTNQHHFNNNNSIHREKLLTVEELVSIYGESLVRRGAKIHGATFEELRPEGTLKALQNDGTLPASSPTSKQREHRDADSENDHSASDDDDNDKAHQHQHHRDADDDADGGASLSPFHSPNRPLTKKEFNSAKKHAAWAIAEEECQRLLSVVQAECDHQLQKETDKEKAAKAAENRLGLIQHRHQERMKREKLQFASRLKQSIESTRSVMQRVKEEGDRKKRQFEEDQRREEEEEMAQVNAFKAWQREMRSRADEAERNRKIRDEQRRKDRELQHWKENQAEMHQWEIQHHAEEKRKREQRAKSAAGRRRFLDAMKIREEKRKEADKNDTEVAVDRLHELEEQERSAHERWRTYQNYTKMRSIECSNHVNAVRNRAKQIEEERLKATEDRRRREAERLSHWRDNFQHQRVDRRKQFNEERELEKRAKEKAKEAEENRKLKARVTLEWLNARSEQQLRVLDQQRAVKQYEQHVQNAAMKRRADRAKRARELRNQQTQAEWSTKMEQGMARSKQREEMAKKARLEKERLAVLANKMRWQASTGKPVDMKPIDQVLHKLEKDTASARGGGGGGSYHSDEYDHDDDFEE